MPAPRMTTDEYLRTPETLLPEELVYGFVRNAHAPTPGHQWALGRLFIALSDMSTNIVSDVSGLRRSMSS